MSTRVGSPRPEAGWHDLAMLRPSHALEEGVLESPFLASVARLTHGFTTRTLGSAGPDGDGAPGDIVHRALAHAGTWQCRRVTQVHGAGVADPFAPSDCEADALVGTRPGEMLIIRTADCLPILLVAVASGLPIAVAGIHAGWRGLVAGVIERGVEALAHAAPRARLIAALGPAIGPCCFEVGPELAESFRGMDPSLVRRGRADRSMADLPGAAMLTLARHSVALGPDARPPCTRCRPDVFHSHRADGAAAGRMAALVGIDAARP